MNKYTLIFSDENIERKYQNQKQYGQNIIIGGLGISFILRCLMRLVDFDWINFGVNLGIVVLLCLLRVNIKSRHFYKRISLIIINCGLSMFVFIYESPSNLMYSQIRGANSAFTSLIIVLSGEFPEAVFQIVFIQLTKLIYIVLKSSETEYEILSGNVLIMIILIYYLYFHHKAIRSQYLLTLVEQKWENVLENIIENQSYFIMNFIQDTYQFNILSQRNCQQYFLDKDYKQFLRESHIEKLNLEDYLFNQIKNHLNNNSCQSEVIFVKNSTSLFKLKYSIYFTTQPTILILFENVQKTQNRNFNLLYYKKIYIYSSILQKFIDNLNNNKNGILKFSNFLKLEILLYKIEKEKFRTRTINIKKFLDKFDLIQDTQLQILQPVINIQTVPCLLSAIILIIQHYSKKYPKIYNSNKTISYTYKDQSRTTIELIFRGCFKSNQIIKLIGNYHYQFLAIIDKLQIKNNEKITISLNKEVFIPFRITNNQK